MITALIGYTGFVGQTLLRATSFDDLYRSTNIGEIRGRSYELIVGAGAPAKKWLANKDPVGDALAIDGLIANLEQVQAKTFVLISTVDVYKSPNGVTESTAIETEGLHPYGYNRWRLEEFVKQHFPRHLIVRLPGLVGAGLRKNIIFDFLNNNNVDLIDSRNVFQFYPMEKLWTDINRAFQAGIEIVHLTAAPVSVREVAEVGFGRKFINYLDKNLVTYNMRSEYADLWGKTDYQYSKEESLEAIRHYALAEPRLQK